jgi:anthranilate synthase component I
MESAKVVDDTLYREPTHTAPVVRELPADLDTPVSVFLKLCRTSPRFLLESVERGEQVGRYSFIGANPYLVVQSTGDEAIVSTKQGLRRVSLSNFPGGADPLRLIQSLVSERGLPSVPGLPRFFGGAVGYLSYDAVRFFEKVPDCPGDDLRLPDATFLFSDTLVIFDHVQHKLKVVSSMPMNDGNPSARREAADKVDDVITALRTATPGGTRAGQTRTENAAPPLVSNVSRPQFVDMVKKAKEYILSGDAFQIVLSQRRRRKTSADPFSVYRALRMLNPSPYMFFLDFGNFQLIGSSPEMLVRLEDGRAETRPIAGTRPRGKTEEEDRDLTADLLADQKERAEHTMLVDLGRNDIGRVCRFGSVRVPLYMSTEKYSHVIHIVSSVQGELVADCSPFDLLRACFPAGTVSGAPKVRAMEIITELEGTKRGPYAGAVGYFGYGGNMDTCITIRTIVMIGDEVFLQGGAGIVADSDPDREYEETLSKTRVLEEAVLLAESWKNGG